MLAPPPPPGGSARPPPPRRLIHRSNPQSFSPVKNEIFFGIFHGRRRERHRLHWASSCRRYDELNLVMQELMRMGIKVVCTLTGMQFDGTASNAIDKATRDAVLAFIAAQGEADYLNRREMQKRGIEVAKAAGDGVTRGERRHSTLRRSGNGARNTARASLPRLPSSTYPSPRSSGIGQSDVPSPIGYSCCWCAIGFARTNQNVLA